jgi:Fe-S oxidoreductase
MARVSLVYFDIHTGFCPSFHHGLASLIGMLRSERHDVRLHHVRSAEELERLTGRIAQDEPNILGLSFTTNQKKYAARFLDCGEALPCVKIAGGVHPTIVGEQLLGEWTHLDGVCLGEAESSLKELCRRIDRREPYLDVPGFCFRQNGQIVRNPPPALPAVETLPLPDYSLFDYENIVRDASETFPMMLARGCPYDCSYCCNHVLKGVYGTSENYVRIPPVSHALRLIRNNLALYPKTRKLVFCDDTFTINRIWLKEFSERYAKEIGLPFFCNARVETITHETVRYLKEAGCLSIDFGVESGSEWLRTNVLNRRHSNKRIEQAFLAVQKQGLHTFSFNLVGLPFETREMMEETLALNQRLRPNFGKVFFFYPYPGSRLYQICEENSLLREGYDQVSGYLEAPALEETLVSHAEIRRQMERLQLFFYFRLGSAKAHLSAFAERLCFRLVSPLRKPALAILDPESRSPQIRWIRRQMRKVALRFFR